MENSNLINNKSDMKISFDKYKETYENKMSDKNTMMEDSQQSK